MGQAAASTLLGLIRDDIPHPHPEVITVYPKLIVRKSTGHVSTQAEQPHGQANDSSN
jgi:DNA-binding LacI/PurR family transcriptional regulator